MRIANKVMNSPKRVGKALHNSRFLVNNYDIVLLSEIHGGEDEGGFRNSRSS